MTAYKMNLTYMSSDGSFGVSLPVSVLNKMHQECIKALPNETGGILVGCYSEDLNLAIIDNLLGKSKNSILRRSSFTREGNDYLQALHQLWTKNQYYLGEWHYHPLSSPSPSSRDTETMKTLSLDKGLNCPEPVLIIIGGGKNVWTISVSVFSNGRRIVLSQREMK